MNEWTNDRCMNFDFFSLAHVPSATTEGAGLMSYAAASHQGAINVFWLHFWVAVMSRQCLQLAY